MNDALQLHLFFNHAPLIGGFAAMLVIIIGLITRNTTVRMSGIAVYVIMALTAIPTYLTGEGAEERVEHSAGYNHDALETHEEHAEVALWVMVAAAVLGTGAFVAQWRSMKPAITKTLFIAFMVIATIAVIKAGFTAHEGGKVMRPELRAS